MIPALPTPVGSTKTRDRWNLNIHYHSVILDAAPPMVDKALDVGCGDGLLSFDLAERGLDVTGIDPDGPSIARAQADPRASSLTEFVSGDLFTLAFEPQSFDSVASVAMLHHIDARSGLRRMRELLRPGGVLAVVGFAKPSGLADRVLQVAPPWIGRTPRFKLPPSDVEPIRPRVDFPAQGALAHWLNALGVGRAHRSLDFDRGQRENTPTAWLR